jgi:hypothetical protein
MDHAVSHFVHSLSGKISSALVFSLLWATLAAAAPGVPVNVTNPSVTVGNTQLAPLNTRDVQRMPTHLIHGGQAFALPPDPNIAFELAFPADAVLTDVELTLHAPSLGTTVFVADGNGTTYIFQTVGSSGSTFAVSTDGHYGLHLQSGISSPAGLRIGIYCPNIGGNSCNGALMWSGYQP